MKLADIFEPLPTARFLVEYFNAAPVHAPGAAGRFATADPANVAEQLERELEADVQPDAQPAAHDSAAIELHRGQRDSIVLYLSGSELWSVYGKDGQDPTVEPTFTALAESGSALYLPRGFWRSAVLRSGPATRLTFHIHNPTGAELLLWLADKAKGLDVYQSDIPRFASPARQADYLQMLRRAFGGAFRTPSLLQNYARRINRLAPSHPAKATPDVITLATPRLPAIYRQNEETIYLSHHGRDIFFPIEAGPLLQYVIDQAPTAVSDFYRQFTGQFEPDELRTFLDALVRDGIIAPLDSPTAL